MRGKLFMTAVIAKGTDKYSVLYALAEIDPAIHTGEVLVADSMAGPALKILHLGKQKFQYRGSLERGIDGRETAAEALASVGL